MNLALPAMSRTAPRFLPVLLTVACLLSSSTSAQNAPAAAAKPGGEEVLELSPFTVSGERASRYQPTQSVSSGRIATAIVDTAQSVSVIPRELIDDVGTGRIFDALKYASGVSESTLPGAIDRITLRGFQTDNGFIDNFFHVAQSNTDPVIVDRIELVKGPNSILNPSGPAGGTINVVTKNPLFRKENSVKVQLGQYDANRVEADFTGPLSDGSKFAYRMLFAYEDSESYHDNTFTKSLVVMPMFTWRISPIADLTVKFLYTDWERPPFLGYPISPSSNSDNDAVMLAGVPRTRSLQDEEQVRFEFRHQVFTNLQVKFSDNFSGRLAINGVYGRWGNQQLLNAGNNFGNRDPNTGKWAEGLSFLQVAPFTASPLPQPSRTYSRNGRVERGWAHRYNVQNIYVLTQETDFLESTSVFGFTADFSTYLAQNQDSPQASINIDSPVYGSKPTVGAVNFKQESTDASGNAFLSQQFRFLEDRLFLSGSYTLLSTKADVINEITSPPATITNRKGDTDLLSWSILAKVLPNLGVYYSDSNNAAPISLLGTPVNAFVFREGKQQELGAKFTFNGGRTVLSAAVFDISVNNFSFPNPAAVGQSNPNIPLAILGSFVSKGWEFEFSSSISSNWTLLGNYSHSKYRDESGIRQRGTADDSAGLFVRYDFNSNRKEGGFYLTAGYEYLGDRAGDFASGLAPASTPSRVIYNQPTFYVGSRNLLNLGAGYSQERWRVDLFLQNALNEEYISATINRNLAITGIPINAKGSFTYRF